MVKIRLPRVPVPKPERVLRDRRQRKNARSSQKSQWRRDIYRAS